MVEDPVVEEAAAEEEVDLEVAHRVLHPRRLDLPAHLAHLAAQAAQAAQEGVVARGIPAPRGKLPNVRHWPILTFPSSSSSSVRPSYGGGKYYGGGATSSYTAGRRSPLGILPLGLGLVTAALIFPGIWLYGVYSYPYTNGYRFRNSTRNRTTTKRQEQEVVLPVTCLCQYYNACGCDDNGNTTFLDSIIGDGTNLNSSLVHIGPVNGTQTIVLNGTLPNGTDTTEDSPTSGSSSRGLNPSGIIGHRFLEISGIWAIGGIVAATVMLL